MNCCMEILNDEDQKPGFFIVYINFTFLKKQFLLENINKTNIPDLLFKFVPKIIAIIKEESSQNPSDNLSTTFGTKFAPFGMGKLKLVSILKLSYSIEENPKIGALLSEENIIEILMVFKQLV